MTIDIASDEYDQAVAHFEGTRSGGYLRPGVETRTRGEPRGATPASSWSTLRNGFAFNLPIVVLGGLALVVYLVK